MSEGVIYLATQILKSYLLDELSPRFKPFPVLAKKTFATFIIKNLDSISIEKFRFMYKNQNYELNVCMCALTC